MNRDTLRTLIITIVLCFVCSMLIASAAVLLKPRQEVNKALDVKKSLLQSSGLIDQDASIEEIESIYNQIQVEVIELATGEVAKDIDPTTFDQNKATKDPTMNEPIPAQKDFANIKVRSKYAPVYKYIKDGKVDMVILPIYGKGLWSTMYAFIALSSDTKTIRGLGFYSHAETAGLGGEVDNPKWKSQWPGKLLYDDNYNVIARLNRGAVNPNSPEAKYSVDGLAGSTITSNGVTNLIRYWLGAEGFGPYLERFRKENASEGSITAQDQEGV